MVLKVVTSVQSSTEKGIVFTVTKKNERIKAYQTRERRMKMKEANVLKVQGTKDEKRKKLGCQRFSFFFPQTFAKRCQSKGR